MRKANETGSGAAPPARQSADTLIDQEFSGKN
jgi:hypothetical protein